ncbi:protein NRT1/ PTR FAMILY 8.1-like [Phaseolus vulgaris]
MAEEDVYTKDGTVDYRGNRANKKETGTWRACPFILGNECSERLAYYGMSTNLVSYFKTQLNQHGATASKNVANWGGTCYITPLIGAFVADAYLGRYLTILYFSVVYVIGMTLLTLSASVPGMKPTCDPQENCHATEGQRAICFVALYLIALGTGGIKPCVSSFGADQFDDADKAEKEHKSSFFNWFYFSINVGALVAASLLVWVQTTVSWGWGFGIPAVAMAIAVVSFFSGTKLYRNQKPGGSPLTRMCQVVVASLRKYDVEVPNDKSGLYEIQEDSESAIQGSRKLQHSNGLRFFDKAAVVGDSDNGKDPVNPWRLCTVTQVEEIKAIVRLLPIWATGIIFSTVYSQMSNYFILQGDTMDNHVRNTKIQISPATLSVFDTISVIFWVPVYDRIIVPIARKFSGRRNGLTQLQRMGTGLFISIFSMVYAVVLENVRLKMVRRHNYYELKEVPMSIFWQVPPYFIIGCAEVFTFIGQLEFFYEQAPDAMRSTCSALQLLAFAFGQYLSSLLITIVTKVTTMNGGPGWLPDKLNYGHLDYFFLLLTVLSVLNFIVFLLLSKLYTYKKSVGTLH